MVPFCGCSLFPAGGSSEGALFFLRFFAKTGQRTFTPQCFPLVTVPFSPRGVPQRGLSFFLRFFAKTGQRTFTPQCFPLVTVPFSPRGVPQRGLSFSSGGISQGELLLFVLNCYLPLYHKGMGRKRPSPSEPFPQFFPKFHRFKPDLKLLWIFHNLPFGLGENLKARLPHPGWRQANTKWEKPHTTNFFLPPDPR